MKKILIAIVSLTFAITSFAQEHMTFKGIPMDGSIRSMMSKLSAQGFKDLGISEGSGMMEGVFSGQQAKILLYSNQKGMVTRIGVIYDKDGLAWSLIRGHYNKLIDGLTKKYGEPGIIEDFADGYEEGSGNELYGFLFDKNHLMARWDTPKGTICMKFVHTYSIEESILLVYEDKINATTEDETSYDDL